MPHVQSLVYHGRYNGTFVPVYTMKAYGGSEGTAPLFPDDMSYYLPHLIEQDFDSCVSACERDDTGTWPS
jgi:hypothetical protein